MHGTLFRTAMNLFAWHNRRHGTAWVLALLVLLFLPGFAGGQWQCEEGRACPSCSAISAGTPPILADDPDCRACGRMELDCRTCCHYVTYDAPALNRTPPAFTTDAPALLADSLHFAAVLLVERRQKGLPHASASPPRLFWCRLYAPRAPPTGC